MGGSYQKCHVKNWQKYASLLERIGTLMKNLCRACISWCSNRLKNGPYPNCQLRLICFMRMLSKLSKSNQTQRIVYSIKQTLKYSLWRETFLLLTVIFQFSLNTDKPGIILQNGASSTSKSTLQIHFVL